MSSQFPETQTIALPDGRTISYAIYGISAPTSTTLTIFYFHGFPASHHEAASFHGAAVAKNIRLIAPDRPGMGRSTFQPGRKLTDWPADVLAIAGHPSVRAPTFAVLGVSGGAPYVLACCRALPATSLRAAGIIAGLYPADLGLAGMLLEPRVLLWIAPWVPGLVQLGLDKSIGAAARDVEHPEKLEELLTSGMKGRPEPDRQVFEENEGGFRDALVKSVRGAVGEPETGAEGAAWELRLSGSAWGFGLEEVRMEKGRLVMWHGAKDVNVPLAMAEKAAQLLEGSELRVAAEESHASLCVHKADEALETLKSRMTESFNA